MHVRHGSQIFFFRMFGDYRNQIINFTILSVKYFPFPINDIFLQINSIQPVAFGYSKKSQKYLEDNIDKKVKDPELQSAIINYSIACNEMEDVVRANEKKFGNRYSDSDFVNLFIEMKDLLITQVVMLFDKDGDRYLESEYGYNASSLPKGKNNREKKLAPINNG